MSMFKVFNGLQIILKVNISYYISIITFQLLARACYKMILSNAKYPVAIEIYIHVYNKAHKQT